MKKLLIASLVVLNTGAAFAGNIYGDGSPQNEYRSNNTRHTQNTNNAFALDNFRDGTIENDYKTDIKINSPLALHGPQEQNMRWGDGSPAQQ